MAALQLDRIGTLCVTRPLIHAGLLRPEPGIAVLMYHSISNDSEPGVASYYQLVTSPARFRQHLQWLRDGGYTVVRLDEAARLIGQSPIPKRTVVITFDDGFRDFLLHAWPVLHEFGFPATMFLATSYIGDRRQSFKGRECLTWQEVRELSAGGVSFGSHTVRHPVLRHLSWAEVRQELAESRVQIENALGTPVGAFAYPYAFPQENRLFSDRFRCELIENGYRLAVTTVIGRAITGADPLCMKRLPINECDEQFLFCGKLQGAYDWVGLAQRAVRRAKTSLHRRRHG